MVLFRSSEERSYKVKKVGFGKITLWYEKGFFLSKLRKFIVTQECQCFMCFEYANMSIASRLNPLFKQKGMYPLHTIEFRASSLLDFHLTELCNLTLYQKCFTRTFKSA